MFKFFRDNAKLLNKKNIAITILILGGIVFIIFCEVTFFRLNKLKTPPPVSGGKFIEPGELPENFKAGEIGKISDEEAKEKGILSMPQIIVNTRGTISAVQADRLIVEGDGSSFVDQQPRTIVIVFTDSTTTNDPAKKTFYTGLEGLKYLKTGMRISIEGAENIKGKTEFKADIVSIL